MRLFEWIKAVKRLNQISFVFYSMFGSRIIVSKSIYRQTFLNDEFNGLARTQVKQWNSNTKNSIHIPIEWEKNIKERQQKIDAEKESN